MPARLAVIMLHVEQPNATPILSDDDIRDYLRIDGTDDAAVITAINAAATERVQEEIGRCLSTTTLIGTADAWPCNERYISLPYPPIQAVVAVTYIDAEGNLQTMSDDLYELYRDRMYILPGVSWPTIQSNRAGAIQVTYIAGYPDDSNGSLCPQPIRQAIKWVAGTMYEHRESVVVGGAAVELPQNVEWALSPYKVRF